MTLDWDSGGGVAKDAVGEHRYQRRDAFLVLFPGQRMIRLPCSVVGAGVHLLVLGRPSPGPERCC